MNARHPPIIRFVSNLFREIVRQRRWLLVPLWLALTIIALCLWFIGGSSILPAIYLAF